MARSRSLRNEIPDKIERDSVVQTTNSTTYQICDVGDDSSAPIYSSDGGKGEIEVPLTAEGVNYFFSGDGDGFECAKGMKFEIKVEKGRGLPATLSQPPPPPQSDVQVPPPPDTVVGTVGGSPQGESFYTGGVAMMVGPMCGWFFLLV